jgi:hypothetical protein
VNIDRESDTHYGHWDVKFPKSLSNLRLWGEAGTVKLRTWSDTKIDNVRIYLYVYWLFFTLC